MRFLLFMCLCVPLFAGDQEPLTIAETYVTESRQQDNVDSIGIYHGSGKNWAFVTAKASDKLLVFDIESGKLLQELGGTGSEPGKLKRPNGVLVLDELLMVVERDNHRVQVWQLPELKHLGFIGENDLEKPYGLSAYVSGMNVELFVTDDFEGENRDTLPPARLKERIKQYRFQKTDIASAKLVKTFGETEGLGKLYKVESIQVDVPGKRIFISDEKGPTRGIKVYDLEGQFTGRMLDTGSFRGEPEGLGILTRGDKRYLVTTDQQPTVSVFHLYDMSDLTHVGAFQGKVTTNTDGISITGQAMKGFPWGALLAIHDDQAMSAFDWHALAGTLLPK